MKKYFATSIALVAILFFAYTSFAANSVNVTGDVTKDANLYIDVQWTADTANFRGQDLSVAREQMYDKIWEKVLPKLVEKTRGYPISFDDSQFVLVSEDTKLLTERPDGSFVYNVKLKIKFACGRRPTTDKVMRKHKTTYSTEKEMDKELRYRFKIAL